MRLFRSAILLLSWIGPALCGAQAPSLNIPSLAGLQRGAVESVNVTVGPVALWVAARIIGNPDPQSAPMKRALHRLR